MQTWFLNAGEFFQLFHNFVFVPRQNAPYIKLKLVCPIPLSANNFEHHMPCRPCRTHEAIFLEDRVLPSFSKLVCHIIYY